MSFFSSTFYFLFGVFSTLYFVIMFHRRRTQESKSSNRLYLNIFILNSKDILVNVVKSKVSRKQRLVRAVAKRLVPALVNDQLLANRIGNDLCSQVPIKLNRQGIPSTATIAYQQSSFLCIEVTIGQISLKRYLESNDHLYNASTIYNNLLNNISWTNIDTLFFDRIFTAIVISRLNTQLPDLIIHKLQLKLSAKIELILCKDEEQGDFLIQTMRELNNTNQQLQHQQFSHSSYSTA